jgi:SAM-dependent methyltransferase
MRGADPARDGERERRGHAVLDLPSRDLKAMKIAALIGAEAAQPPRRMLEIGTGSGGIARYFGTAGPMGWDVDALDVEDVRLASEGYRFTRVDGVHLPFADASFDVVVSNHVIEHVGDTHAQALHLAELARVLRPDGVGYLAVPCRWMLVEPHYRLPFLSWLPRPVADAYVRAARKGSHYDCRPLTTTQLESALCTAGFVFAQQHGRALRLTYELERPDAPLYRYVLKPIPDRVYALLRRVFPTLIYTLALRPADNNTSSRRATSAQEGSVP